MTVQRENTGPASEKTPPGEVRRSSSYPQFWNARYARPAPLFGVEGNPFVLQEAERIPDGGAVIELGAGEARNLVALAPRRSLRPTAVDFAGEGLETARRLSAERGVSLRVVEADVRRWQPAPAETWDAVLVTFLHLLPDERTALYQLVQRLLRPGGVCIAEWFRPEHLADPRFARIGPSRADRLVGAGELRARFPEEGVRVCEEADAVHEEGPVLRGRAATVRFVWQKGS